ncbi:hypothetical protein Agub_g6594 [Astrephomene gubernaculifera]|uniref:BRO1 domain-containing protein n=1 Tax=Astrephomene gubernaculifera TaxID=47775 RepID=A0AAD3HLX8_9CHLO|nr:hypothetical protein Agub_g6594 [Astrephomene gubernaculifera]
MFHSSSFLECAKGISLILAHITACIIDIDNPEASLTVAICSDHRLHGAATMAEAACGFVLPFYEPLQLLQTKPYDFTQLGKQHANSPTSAATAAALAAYVRPDFLAELSFHRGALSAWLQQQATTSGSSSGSGGGGFGAGGTAAAVVPEGVLEGLAALAARLHGLTYALAGPAAASMAAPAGSTAAEGLPYGEGGGNGGRGGGAAIAAAAAVTAGMLRTEWTSALSSKPQRMLKLDSLPQELAMVYTTTAAAMRQAAHQRLEDSLASATSISAFGTAAGDTGTAASTASAPASPGTATAADNSSSGTTAAAAAGALTSAVASLRRAAGLYGYLADEMLPELGTGAGAGGERPLELLPPAARLMQLLCLAEGQALMAAAAEARGMAPGTQRALHAGCLTLLRQAEAAAAALAAASPPSLPPASRLPRLLGVSCGLHEGRCLLARAAELQRDMQLGEAEAACEECMRVLGGAARRLERSDPPAWGEAIKAQQARCAPLLAAVHKDRLAVTYQPLPKQPPDATANAAVRVTPEPFRPVPVAPPLPPPDQGAKPGCALM